MTKRCREDDAGVRRVHVAEEDDPSTNLRVRSIPYKS